MSDRFAHDEWEYYTGTRKVMINRFPLRNEMITRGAPSWKRRPFFNIDFCINFMYHKYLE